jgi:hypothetical protein
LYEPTQEDLTANIDAVALVLHGAESALGKESVARDRETKTSSPMKFAVARDDGRVFSSLEESKVLDRIPAATFDRVFVVPERKDEAERWLQASLRGILNMHMEES